MSCYEMKGGLSWAACASKFEGLAARHGGFLAQELYPQKLEREKTFPRFLNDTRFILNSVSTVKLQHVKREANEVAHRLAPHGLTGDLRNHPI